jgi:glycosyltransferase involved in cell wall biosynthesis
MRIALVAPPFIPVPPVRYGGTELFVAHLATELHARGHDVRVYTNGASRLPCHVRSRYEETDWPIADARRAELKHADHVSWAIEDAASWADLIHLNDPIGVPFTRFVDVPFVVTLHHSHDDASSEQYARYPSNDYVAIGEWLAAREHAPKVHVVHHGIALDAYTTGESHEYAAFLGRIAPCKGTHLAIEVAKRANVRLKIAGEVQPQYRSYWEAEVRPHIDGTQIEFLGEADLALKNDLLSHARALLFPIQWEEPFGLVMIEAMACGAPVLALPGGAVAEVVANGVSGFVCSSTNEMAERIVAPLPAREGCRAYVEERFTAARMTDRYLEIYARVLDERTSAPQMKVA